MEASFVRGALRGRIANSVTAISGDWEVLVEIAIGLFRIWMMPEIEGGEYAEGRIDANVSRGSRAYVQIGQTRDRTLNTRLAMHATRIYVLEPLSNIHLDLQE